VIFGDDPALSDPEAGEPEVTVGSCSPEILGLFRQRSACQASSVTTNASIPSFSVGAASTAVRVGAEAVALVLSIFDAQIVCVHDVVSLPMATHTLSGVIVSVNWALAYPINGRLVESTAAEHNSLGR